MRGSRNTLGRRAGILIAATLIPLTAAACGPVEREATPPGAAGRPAAIDPAQIPTPAPTPAEITPGTPTPGPEAELTGPQSENEGQAAADAPVDRVPTAPASTSPAAPPPAPLPAPAPARTPAPALAGAASAGSGGELTDQGRRAFTAGNGHTGRYLLYAAGIDPSKPVGLIVYLDGTGEFGVDNPDSPYVLGGSSGLVATGKARNMITLAVESPDQSCECWHTGDTSGYADFLAALIEEQFGAYPVGEVWLTGFSSGAQEVTRFLVPRHPEIMRLGGGWVVFGGGGPPAGNASAVTIPAMAGVRGHWFTGTADTSVPMTAAWGAQAGERFYARRGVVTSGEYPSGVGHALDGRLGRTVAQVIDAS